MTICSVVIPCYNQPNYLAESLESVHQQSLTNWEVIIVDDGSTEPGIQSVVDTINDTRVRLVRHPKNRGLAAARNTGFREARGEYVLPLDSDDVLMPDALKKLAIGLQNSKADIIFPDFRSFGTCEGTIHFEVKNAKDLLIYQWIPGSGTLMRKKIWDVVGGYCEDEILRSGNEDWDFYLSLAEVGFTAIHFSEPLYCYRQTPQSMSKHLQFVDYLTREFMYQRHKALFDQYHAGPAFLSEGYIRSARAWWQTRKYVKVISLLLRAARFKYAWKRMIKRVSHYV